MSQVNKRIYVLLFCVLVFIFLFAINTLTPLSLQDDFLYKFAWIGKNKVAPEYPYLIHTISDIFSSQYYHWLSQNGRLVPHLLLQIFDCLFAKWMFNIFNALAFVSLLCIIIKVALGKLEIFYLSLLLCLILFLTPSFDETSLWMAGSFNYLWSALFALVYIYIIKNIWKEHIKIKYCFIAPFCLFLTWINEAATIPIFLTLSLYAFCHFKQIYRRAIFPYILILALGVCITVLSPSTLSRLSESSSAVKMTMLDSLIDRFKILIVAILNLKIFWIFVIVLLFSYFKHKEELVKKIKTEGVLYAIAFCSLIVFFLSGKYYPRVRYIPEIYFSVSTVSLLSIWKIYKKTIMSVFLTVFSFSFLLIVLYYSKLNFQDYKYCLSQLKQPGKSIILTNSSRIPYFIDDYVMQFVDFGTPRVWYFACDYTSDYNKDIAILYNKNKIIFFPKDLYFDIKQKPQKYETINSVTPGNLFVKRLKKDEDIKKVFFHYNNGVQESPRSMAIVPIDCTKYLVFTKPIYPHKTSMIKKIEIIQ